MTVAIVWGTVDLRVKGHLVHFLKWLVTKIQLSVEQNRLKFGMGGRGDCNSGPYRGYKIYCLKMACNSIMISHKEKNCNVDYWVLVRCLLGQS